MLLHPLLRLGPIYLLLEVQLLELAHGSSVYDSQDPHMIPTIPSTVTSLQSPTKPSTSPEKLPKMIAQDVSIQQALTTAKAYRARDSSKASVAIASNYLISASCIVIVQWASGTSHLSAAGSRALYLLSTVIIASRMRALENLVHEASHHNLFPSAHLHRRLQFLYAFPIFRVLEDYRRSHLVHHKHLGDPQKDPDAVRLYNLGLDRLPERPVWYLLGVPMTGYLTYEYMTTTFREFWESPSSRLSKSVFWVVVMLAVGCTATLQYFAYYYMIPFLVILPVMRYWAEASEHLGLDLRRDFGSSRTNIGFLHTWCINPHNDGYHAVHHLCSQIPFHLLPEAHQHLMKASNEFAKKTAISYGMLETFKQIATKKTIFRKSNRTEQPSIAVSLTQHT